MQLLIVLIILFGGIALINLFVFFEPKLDLVYEDNTKKLLLWYNKYGDKLVQRHWIKLLEF